MNFKQRNHFEKQTILSDIVLFALIIVVALGGVYVLARYISTFSSANKEAGAAEFYFLTDLSENSKTNPYPVYDGNIKFTVKNNDGFNVSKRNIAFTVTASLKNGDDITQVESFLDETLVAVEVAGDVAQKAEKAFIVKVETDGDYIVTIQSNSPYAKTITLYFRVNTHYADSFYTVTSYNGWMLMDLYTGEDNGDIDVSYGQFQPDNTLELMSDWQSGNGDAGNHTLENLESYSHYQLIFFGDYDVSTNNPFELTQSGKKLVQSGASESSAV